MPERRTPTLTDALAEYLETATDEDKKRVYMTAEWQQQMEESHTYFTSGKAGHTLREVGLE